MRTCLTLTLLVILLEGIFAQSITWGPANPAGSSNLITVYNGTSTYTIEFTNNGTALTAASLEVTLGTGIEYVAGGLTFTTSAGATVTEVSATGDNPALFTIGALAAGELVTVTFTRQGTCDARAHKSSGGTFTDVARVLESGAEVSYSNNGGNPFSSGYDVIYANLVLGAVTHTPGSAAAIGETVNRSYNVTNGSFGSIDEFWLEDVFNAGELTMANFMINGVAIPVANIVQNAGRTLIHFDATLIAMINGTAGTTGNGDAYFEKDEFFTISYDVTPLECTANNTQPSTLKVYYGEDENTECAPSGTSSTSVSVTNGTPLITSTRIVNNIVDVCLTTTHSIEIKNNGTGPEDFAKDLVIFIGFRANASPIATLSNVTMWGETYNGTRDIHDITINGNPLTTSTIPGIFSTVVDYLPPNFLTSDPDGAGTGLDDLDGDGFYDDLGPGESLIIEFHLKTTPKERVCGKGRADYMHWEHLSADINAYNQCGVLQVPIRTEFSYKNMIRDYNLPTLTDGPSDINDGDNFDVLLKPHLVNSLYCNGGNGLTGPSVSWTVKLVLPSGVSLQANPPIDPVHMPYAPSLYQSNDTVIYEINRYQYEWFTFPLTLDCSLWDGTNPIPFDFITTYTCDPCYEEDIHCETILIVPQCPSPCVGVTTDDFEVIRSTRGWTDATMTSHVTLTPGTHATYTMLPYDTIDLVAKGHMADTLTDNLHLKIKYTPEIGGDILTYESAVVTFYDLDGAYGNVQYDFPITTPPTVTATAASTFEWGFDLSTYITQIDPGYELGEGFEADSFTVVIKAIYNQNAGNNLYKVEQFRAEFFMYDDVPIERSCNSYGAPLFYSGFTWSTSGSEITLEGCNEQYIRTYATWYNLAGNVFPNEYRPIERVDTVIVDLPDGVNVNDVQASSYSNGTASYYFDANDDLVITPNSDYTPKTWSSITYPGFDIFLTGSCEMDEGTYKVPMTMVRTLYNYHPDTSLHVQVTNTESVRPTITYIKPTVSATPLGQIQQGVTDTVAWDIEICNSTSDLLVDYSWITYDESSSAGIQVVAAADITTGTEIPVTPTNLAGDVFLVETGLLNGGECKTIRLFGTYGDCAEDEILFSSSWDCEGYPIDTTTLPNCSEDDFLSVVPQDAQIAATITPLASTPADPSDPAGVAHGSSTIEMCEPFPVEYRIVSSGTATIYDINFDLLFPSAGTGLTYVPNSGTIEVEGVDAANVPRPLDATGEAAFVAGTTNILLGDLDATNFGTGLGLTGAGTNALQNEVVIRFLMEPDCSFVSGEIIKIKTLGDAPCSEPATGSGEQVVGSALKISGIVLPYTSSFNTSFSPDNQFIGCADTAALNVKVQVSGGITGSNDSLLVTLSEGLTYDGIYTCNSPSCPTYIEVRTVAGKEVVVFHYPPGLTNPLFDIDLGVASTPTSVCVSSAVEVQSTVQIGGLLCDGVACPSSKVITGAGQEVAVTANPELDLEFTSMVYDGVIDSFFYTLDVTNTGIASDGPIELDIYCSNTTFDGPDLAAGVVTTVVLPIMANGSTTTVSGSLPYNTCSPFTGYAAVVSPTSNSGADNCICGAESLLMATENMPVELVYFDGEVVSCQGYLSWRSESEIDFKHYEIQRSSNGFEFETIEVIPGKGSPIKAVNYEYIDRYPQYPNRVCYYRLKMVDLDGTTAYSDVLLKEFNGCSNQLGIQLIPNPVSTDRDLTLTYLNNGITNDDELQIQVFNSIGQKVMEELSTYQSVTSGLKLSISKLPPGTYFLKVIVVQTRSISTKKFLILNK